MTTSIWSIVSALSVVTIAAAAQTNAHDVAKAPLGEVDFAISCAEH